MNICDVKGCENKSNGKLCSKHYARKRKYGSTDIVNKRANNSGSLSKNGVVIYKPQHPNSWKNGKIYEHVYVMSEFLDRPISKDEKIVHLDGNKLNNDIENLKLEKKVCKENGCIKKIRAKGFCSKHYRALLSHGCPSTTKRNENGKGTINNHGYRLLFMPKHPNANKSGRILEHRLVMSEKLGRPLRKNENVHHINGNRLDNRPSNLELWVKSQPCGQRARDILKWAKEIIETYKNEEDKI